ncbi:MAG: ShlB/FhaC/HecB family hemolysin secretion/activation protein [Pseudomonadales bacterium]|nr:ShlB/FhaC/HecB family hemolysin secretion/activation protein [Pseudomonadales bacterium]
MKPLFRNWLGALLLLVMSPCGFAAAVDAFAPFEFDGFRELQDKADPFEGLDEKDIVVPRVSERRYSEEELQKLPVSEIVIEGVVPYPELGITQESVQQLVTRRLIEEQDIELDENGFTRRDVKEISRFLRNLADRGGEDEEDLAELMNLIRFQEFARGWITIEQLDAIAASVTEFYRDKGFILATAFIPEQEVADNVIRFSILEGRLGEVRVSNNEIYPSEVVTRAFYNEMGEAVTEERIEGALRRINDLPGLRVRGSFSPGQNIGETSLNLSVLEEKAWNANILIDNHGSATTGETRMFATAEWLNVAGLGHRVMAGVLRSEGPDASTYGLLEYELPVTKDGHGRFKGSVSRNQFSVLSDLAGSTEIVGETDNFNLTGMYQFVRSRTLNLSAQASYVYKDVLFDVQGLAQLSTDQQVEIVSVYGDYSNLWDEKQLLVNGRLGLEQGHIIKGENQLIGQSTDFTKTVFNVNLLKRFSVYNWLSKKNASYNLVLKGSGQYAEQLLPSVEQYSLGGPNAVRAFGVSDISVDSGVYAGVELFFDLPFDPLAKFSLPLDPIRPYVFFDYAYGVRRSLSSNDDAEVKGYGIGMRLNWADYGSANIIFATPRSASYDAVTGGAEGESRFFLDLTYKIH